MLCVECVNVMYKMLTKEELISRKEPLQKITAEVSAMQEKTGKGIIQTVIERLKKLKAKRAYKKLLALEGSIDLDLDMVKLREDRVH